MKVAPVVNAVLPVLYGSLVEFTFTDDPQWRAAINSITYLINSNNIGYGEVVDEFQKDAGMLTWNINYGLVGTVVWTIKATGYEDVVVN